MCGIVGAVGHVDCSQVLLEALKRLEYRGYDSSGIVTIHQEKFGLDVQLASLSIFNANCSIRPFLEISASGIHVGPRMAV